MNEPIAITKFAKKVLEGKKKELTKEIEKQKEENALSILYRSQLVEIDDILENCTIFEENGNEPAVVRMGSKVLLENLRSGIKREYTIMSRATSNPLSGTISNESPLAQKILGLKEGNTFKFCENGTHEDTFKVKSIE